MSHRRLCRLPSLPLSSASRRRMESRRDGGLRGGVMPTSAAWASLRAIVTPLAPGWLWLSSGMARGVPPVPRESGETLSDSRAEMVHASMSMVPEAVWPWWGAFGMGAGAAARALSACWWWWWEWCVGGGDSGGGGTALYFPIAMVGGL